MNLAVIIPAAGRGARFGGKDKLLQDLGGRPLLVRTVEAFTKRDEVKSIVLGGPPDDLDAFRDRYGATLGFLGVRIVAGGRIDRWETVRNALAEVPEDCTHVAVHDAARPNVDKAMLDRVLEAARRYAAVIPVVPVSSTLKRLGGDAAVVSPHDDEAVADAILGDAGKLNVEVTPVVETVDRAGLAAAQTPQVFAADLLRRAYAQDELAGLTDDAAAVERLGETVYAVPGDVNNVKVTTPEDLRLVRALLGVREPAERPVHKRF